MGKLVKVRDYEKFVQERARIPLTNLAYSVIGLGGETGEVLEWYKKSVVREDPAYDDDHLRKELGDVIHYVTRIALQKGWSLKEIMQANIDKLVERHGS